MPSNFKIALGIFICILGMFGYVYHQKKQFYPTVVFLSKSGAAISAFYVEALFLGLIASTILRKIFFGELRPVESERLAERSWYALTETCLAFTIFKEEAVPVFIFRFAFLIFMKNVHLLTEERVELFERSVLMTKIFHVRIISVFFLLSAIDASFILYALKMTILRGASIQVVFGFEYCILFIMLLNNFIKYATYVYASIENISPEDRAVAQMYITVVMNTLKMCLYIAFFLLMIRMFTFPLFVLRPMYFTMKAFKKSVVNVLMTRRALKFLNDFYPDVTQADLALDDNACIICREELTMASKKLPCNHIFHTACLRAWFQRQQTCPTCRFGILKVPQHEQLERMRGTRSTNAETQTVNEPASTCSCAISDGAQSIDNMTEDELVATEHLKREELRLKIKKLTELAQMMDAATEVIEHLPNAVVSSSSDASTHRARGEFCGASHVNLRLIRNKRMQALSKAKASIGETSTDL